MRRPSKRCSARSGGASRPDGGAALALSPDLGDEPWGIATDGTNVDDASMDHGSIVKVSVGGGAATVLAWGQVDPAMVAVAATQVYRTVEAPRASGDHWQA